MSLICSSFCFVNKTAEITHTNVNFPTQETVCLFNYSMVLLQGQDEASGKKIIP